MKNLYLFKDIGSDTLNSYYPNYVHIANYLRNEGIPKWSFHQGMGQNIFPSGLNRPFNILIYLLGSKNIAYGIEYVEFIKVFLAGIIFYFYLGLLGLENYTRIVGSLLFAFSGYMILGTGWYAHSSYVTYGAFLLLTFELLLKKK
ncbi:MAG: YfhO family protein [Ignavibacteriae bacterium]|nr:YfhO family protein [Ignavibacteriota bacterium]